MKYTFKLFFLAVMTVGFCSTSQAQKRAIRGDINQNRSAIENPSSNERSPQRTFSSSPATQRSAPSERMSTSEVRSPQRTMVRSQQRSSDFQNDRPAISSAPSASTSERRSAFTKRDNPIRSQIAQNQAVGSQNTPVARSSTSNTRTYTQSSVNTPTRYRGSSRTYNNSGNGYNTGSRNYNTYGSSNYYYRNGYDRRIYVMNAPRYNYRPYNSISIYYGGNPYYYSDGLFYDYYSGYYQPIYPPYGIRISSLPFGFSRIYVGVNPFYYYNGIFYREYDRNYEVVDAPLGAAVRSLPRGAKSVMINGEKFYELNGTYYKQGKNEKRKKIYTVVGKHGEINNSESENVTDDGQSTFENGDIIHQLPEGSKIVTLDGEKLYVTPDDIYLKEEVNGNQVEYKVVGK